MPHRLSPLALILNHPLAEACTRDRATQGSNLTVASGASHNHPILMHALMKLSACLPASLPRYRIPSAHPPPAAGSASLCPWGVNTHPSYLSSNLLRRCAISSPNLFTAARKPSPSGVSVAMCEEGRRDDISPPTCPPSHLVGPP